MCCFYTVLLLSGPRVANIIWWFANPGRWVGVLGAFDSAIWPILGILFLPWTTLMYVLIYPSGLAGLNWLWMGFAIFADFAMYAGGGYGNRGRINYRR